MKMKTRTQQKRERQRPEENKPKENKTNTEERRKLNNNWLKTPLM